MNSPAIPEYLRIRLAASFLAAGGLAMTAQIILLRELMVGMQGDEISIALGLFVWLTGIAVGASAARRVPAARSAAAAGSGLALLALATPCGILVARLAPTILAPPAGELFPVGPTLVLAALVLAPPGALVGWTFTSLAATARHAGYPPGSAITAVYVLEAVGALVAGLALTSRFLMHASPLPDAVLFSLGWAVVTVPAAWCRHVAGRVFLPVVCAVLALAGLPPVSGFLEHRTAEARFAWQAPGIPLLDRLDTPYRQIAIGGGEVRHLYDSGRYVTSFPDPAEHEMHAHTVACMAPVPGRVLLFGSASAVLVRPLLEHPVRSIDLVVLDRRAHRRIVEHLGPRQRRALEDARVRVVHDDPRRFLGREGDRYDLIIVPGDEPATLLQARLYTVEFHRLCRSRLDVEGVVVSGMRTGPNVLTGETARLAGSIYRSLREVYPVVRFGPGPEALLVAGNDPAAATLDPEVLATRYRERAIRSEFFVADLFEMLFPRDRVREQERRLREEAAGVPASRDQRPVSFLHALRVRQRIEGSLLAPVLGRVARVAPIYLCVLALLPSLGVIAWIAGVRDPERATALAAVHAVTVTGACGIGWSLLVLFSYQARAGALYGRIGLLTAAFMLGLAAGGACLRKLASAPPPRTRRWLPLVCTAATAYAALVAAAIHLQSVSAAVRWIHPLLHHGLLVLGAGFVTGAVFPVAAGALLASGDGVRRAAGRLETADHAGAALAALGAGVIFVPALGLTAGALLLVVLEGLALQGVILGVRKPPR